MSNTHDDDLDPTAGILADLASLRASRDAADETADADPDTLSALDDIAAAAARLREDGDSDGDSDEETGEDGRAEQAPTAAGASTSAPAAEADRRPRSPRSTRSSDSLRGLVFESYSADQDGDGSDSDAASGERTDSADAAGDGPVTASAPVDPRNPFSHSSGAPSEDFAPVAAPAGGGLLFQAPQEEYAQPADPEWFDDDSDDHDDADDRYSSDDSDDRLDSDDRYGSDDRGDGGSDGGDGRGRSRRRRGGRGRRSRGRERSAEDGSDESGDGTDASDSSGADDESSGDGGRRGSRRGRRRRGSDGPQNDSGTDSQSRSDSGPGSGSDGGRSDADISDDDGGGGRSAGGKRPQSADDEARGGSSDDSDGASDGSDDDSGSSRRRRRRRGRSPRRDGGGNGSGSTGDDQVTAIKGSTRLEAKRQRRREGREAGRRRPLLTEAEFLARRESVSRTMVIREQKDRTQLAVLEDGVTVEHYLSEHKAQASLIGNVYLGRVQNVLPSMEAAFIDIGKGSNAVLYAGEVNWDALGMTGKPQRIEQALSSGDSVLVQVTKDPVGHKGARLTSQISLPGRFLVYIPGNSMTGISRKLPDNERARLKKLLKEILPDQAGVIVRTASEGASDDELRRDVERLTKRWDSIQKKSKAPKAPSPKLLYSEPDMIVRIIRDVFNEDFDALVVDGEGVWDTIHEYVEAVAPDLLERVSRYGTEGTDTADAGAAGTDIFDHFRVNEQVEKALHRKVNLPSGGSLVIDRTEAMTVVDVNTGKFTGSGGNLEETVTKNNLEAADEVIRQLRLRDIGGIIVVDFIDMVLESNRDLVTRRLVECLARDRTRHQVAEVTSLGLVQMTRKRIGTGLAESLAAAGEDLSGRGLLLPGSDEKDSGSGQKGGQRGRRQGKGGDGGSSRGSKRQPSAQDDERDLEEKNSQSRSAVAAIAKATLKKSDDGAGGGTKGEAPQDATADRPTGSTDPSDEQAESASEGRRPRRGGGRSRGSSRSTEAPQGTRQSAPPPPEPTGPMPLMIGAESATTVQTQPTPEPAATTTAPTTDVRPADAQPASAGTSSAEASDEPASADQDAESSAPTGPILMLGMDD